jgi:hypothetical protein
MADDGIGAVAWVQVWRRRVVHLGLFLARVIVVFSFARRSGALTPNKLVKLVKLVTPAVPSPAAQE